MRHVAFFVIFGLIAMVRPPVALAEIWCAEPLWVHEWGVQVFGGSHGNRTAAPQIPTFFHGRTLQNTPPTPPVRHLPADGGERELPVMHFYAPVGSGPIPVGLEVGFAQGQATRWYPQVDLRRTATRANSPAAQLARRSLIQRRTLAAQHRRPFHPPADPTRQLIWHHLLANTQPSHPPVLSQVPWVNQARAFDHALWMNTGRESERFVFYEGRTHETQALVLSQPPLRNPIRERSLVLTNTSNHDVFDVLFVHHEAGQAYVSHMPSIPAHASSEFILYRQVVSAQEFRAATRGVLMTAITDAQTPSPPEHWQWNLNVCVTGQNPAVPTERAEGHRLYRHEAELILDAWESAFFESGTTLIYREDTAYLDEVMPVSVHTDMFHFVRLRRLGLALVTDIALP